MNEKARPGWKFTMGDAGVPLRVELGPRDVAKQAAVSRAVTARQGRKDQRIARRLPATLGGCCKSSNRFTTSLGFPQEQHTRCENYEELRRLSRMACLLFWCGVRVRSQIKEETAPPCAAFPWSRRRSVIAFTALSPPLRARSSPGLLSRFFPEHLPRQFLDTPSSGASFGRTGNHAATFAAASILRHRRAGGDESSAS